jgi:hypothetical protein
MGTKNNPGQFNCYDKAENNEPLFTLLGRDPQGADFVHLWAALRAKDYHGADRIFDRMKLTAANQAHKHGDADKVAEAVNCAEAMRSWRTETAPKVETPDA